MPPKTNIGANPNAVIVARALGFDLRRFTGPSADIALFTLDDEDVDACDVVAACGQIVPGLVALEVGRQRGRVDYAIDLDAIDNRFDPTRNAVDAQMLVDAFKIAIPALVRQELNRLRGRVD